MNNSKTLSESSVQMSSEGMCEAAAGSEKHILQQYISTNLHPENVSPNMH